MYIRKKNVRRGCHNSRCQLLWSPIKKKNKTKIIKSVKLYAGLKTATDIGVETARRVTVRTDRFPGTWVFWVINGFECAKVIVIE